MFGLGKLQEAQEKMEETKQKLGTISVQGEAENGSVVVIATADRKITSIKVSDELMASGDKEQLEELITVATNRALEQASQVAEAEMQAIAKDMMPGLGGLGNLFGGK